MQPSVLETGVNPSATTTCGLGQDGLRSAGLHSTGLNAGSTNSAGSNSTSRQADSSTEANMSPRLIDWNAYPPNGSLASQTAVLQRLESVFKAQVFVTANARNSPFDYVSAADLEKLRADDAVRKEPTQPAAAQHISDESKELSSLVRSAVAEASKASGSCLFATESARSSLVLEQLRQRRGDVLTLSFACTSAKLQAAWGFLICIRQSAELQSKPVYEELVGAVRTEWVTWIETWNQCRAGAGVGKWRDALAKVQKGRFRLCVFLCCLLVGAMFIPLPYWPQRKCEVEPASRIFLASPIDGRLERAFVRPGDSVQIGDVLARIDDEQLRWDMAEAEANYQAATKRRDTALATRAGGDMRLAQLEQQRFEIEIDALRRQIERLELRSPIDGIVAQGDWHQSEGAPVRRGDMLFEIAPLHEMQVEIQLSSEDLADIEVQFSASAHFDIAPWTNWTSRIERIDPRGKVEELSVVFPANMRVANKNNLLRPGMQGLARIDAGQRSLGWLLFHRPALWVTKKLAW